MTQSLDEMGAYAYQLRRQLRAAQTLALAADIRLSRILRYANKDLDASEIARLTELDDMTVSQLLRAMTAAGLCAVTLTAEAPPTATSPTEQTPAPKRRRGWIARRLRMMLVDD